MRRDSNPPNVDISLTVYGENKSFTTHDVIAGRLQLKSARKLDDLDLRVTFEGSSFTCIKNTDSLHTHLGRVIGKHRFLNMPIDISDQPSTMQAGQVLALPFRLHIPSQIPQCCTHSMDDVDLQAQHTMLPPSMVLSKRVILEDGVTVDAAKIAYGIRVVIRSGDVESGRNFKTLEVAPTSHHTTLLPRLLLCGEVMLKSSQGASKEHSKLVVETESLPVFDLPHPSRESPSVLGNLDLLLRYESTESNAMRVQIAKIDIKVKAITYYNARPFRSPPSIPESTAKGYRYLEETFVTSTFALGKVDWETQDSSTSQISERIRLDPASTILSPLSSVLTTTISVPFTMPAGKTDIKSLPTFDTCLISRNYFAELDFTFPHMKTAAGSFRVPIRITNPHSAELPPPDVFSMSGQGISRLSSPPDYSEYLLDDLPAYEPTDLRLVQNDGRIETFAYVKSEPWLNIHNGFKHGYKKLKGHLEVRQARSRRER